MKATDETSFAQESQAYERMKSKLLELCEGQYALFKGSKFCGSFDTAQTAYNAGISRYGNVPFLIQPVEREESAVHFPALGHGLLHAHL